MIARIEGIIVHIADKFLIIDVSGVGYKLNVTTEAIASSKLGDHTSFWVHTAVRENSIDLYGLKNMNEMAFFELLLDVSGIGPRSALGILAVAPIDILKRAIATGDTSYLNKVSGIGRKTAEKIIVELRDKLKDYKDEDDTSGSLRDESDILEALKSLGYSQNEARDALKQVPSTTVGTNARIKEALQVLGKR
ncbi:MAG TPA: Holliday junction branch migration protein RuvA [Candidatus Paceibacterota bacterium]|nr:Holliday junction branch migration protein RuvA [Candidatus Paceibacterota bacterium]